MKDEIHSRTVIQARIQADTGDHSKNQNEIHAKRDKVDKKVSEVENALHIVLEKVTKLRDKHSEKTEVNIYDPFRQALSEFT